MIVLIIDILNLPGPAMRFVALLLFCTLTSHSLAGEPPMYPYPAPEDIKLEDIIPAAMDNLKAPGPDKLLKQTWNPDEDPRFR